MRPTPPDDAAPLYPTGGALAYQPASQGELEPPAPAIPSPQAPRKFLWRKDRATPAGKAQGPDAEFDETIRVAPGRGRLQKALARAFERHAAGKSVRVLLAPGVYRESFAAGPSPSAARLLIEAREPGRTFLRGSNIWQNWRVLDGRWHAPWPHCWGLGNAPDAYGDPNLATPDLMRRREMVFVEGRLQRQVLTRADLAPATFFIDESAGEILLQPTENVLPEKALVEVGIRSGLLEINGRRNVTLRGLTFEHDASFFFTPQRAALQLHNCRDVLVEDCTLHWNNVKGLQITGPESEGVALRRVAANHNGCLGILASGVRSLHLEDTDTSFNNWRGAWAGKYRGSPCGLKIMRSRGISLLRHRALRNQATGIWLDEENRVAVLRQCVVHGNARGIHLEAGGGPIVVENCTVTGNRQEPALSGFRWAFGSGIALTHMPDVTLRGNFFADNDVAQIGVRDDRETRTLADPATGEKRVWRSAGLTLEDNTFVAHAGQRFVQIPAETFDARGFLDSLRADRNLYVGPAAGFGLGSFHSATPRRDLDFAEWQALTRQDIHSTHEPL
jgi:hypothetical protein